MPRYGSIHRVADFVARLVPKRRAGEYQDLFVHRVIHFLKVLDAVQESNPWVTLTTHAGDGIWFSYRGQRVFLILPGKQFLRLLVGDSGSKERRDLIMIAQQYEHKGYFENITGANPYHQWRVKVEAIPILEQFASELPCPSDHTLSIINTTHPRNFPGLVRQVALETFERNGSYCPGAGGRRRHKVDLKRDRVEFDHILPYSRGGASSGLNIQVLCQECNRAKHAKAF